MYAFKYVRITKRTRMKRTSKKTNALQKLRVTKRSRYKKNEI